MLRPTDVWVEGVLCIVLAGLFDGVFLGVGALGEETLESAARIDLADRGEADDLDVFFVMEAGVFVVFLRDAGVFVKDFFALFGVGAGFGVFVGDFFANVGVFAAGDVLVAFGVLGAGDLVGIFGVFLTDLGVFLRMAFLGEAVFLLADFGVFFVMEAGVFAVFLRGVKVFVGDFFALFGAAGVACFGVFAGDFFADFGVFFSVGAGVVAAGDALVALGVVGVEGFATFLGDFLADFGVFSTDFGVFFADFGVFLGVAFFAGAGVFSRSETPPRLTSLPDLLFGGAFLKGVFRPFFIGTGVLAVFLVMMMSSGERA